MNLLDSIMNAGNGAAVRQIGAEVGPDEAQATRRCRPWTISME